jgi:hypothetical protein
MGVVLPAPFAQGPVAQSVPAWANFYALLNGIGPSIVTPVFSATTTVNISNLSGAVVINLAVNANLTFDITGGFDGQVIRVWFTQTGGPFTFTPGAHLEAATGGGAVPFPATLSANLTDTFGFQWRSAQGKALLVATVTGFA